MCLYLNLLCLFILQVCSFFYSPWKTKQNHKLELPQKGNRKHSMATTAHILTFYYMKVVNRSESILNQYGIFFIKRGIKLGNKHKTSKFLLKFFRCNYKFASEQ